MVRWRPWLVVLVLTACNAVAVVDRQALSLLAQPVKVALSLSDLQIGLLQGPAFSVLFALLALPLGRLADLVNRRTLITFAVVIWSLSTAAFGLARNFGELFASRIAVAVGEAGLVPSSYSLFGDLFDKRQLGRAMSIFVIGAVLGNGGGLILSGSIYGAAVKSGTRIWPIVGSLDPWQLTFLAVGAPGLLIAAAVWRAVAEPNREGGAQRSLFRAAFIHVWRQRRFYFPALLAYTGFSAVVTAFLAWTPTFLIRSYHSTPKDVGHWFGLIMLGCGLTSPLFFGWVADQLYRRWGVLAGLRLICALMAVTGGFGFWALHADSLESALVGVALLMVVITGTPILPTLSIQMVTPSGMRGQMTSMTSLCGYLIGSNAGSLLVPLLERDVFPGEGLGTPIATVIAVFSALGCAACLLARLPKDD